MNENRITTKANQGELVSVVFAGPHFKAGTTKSINRIGFLPSTWLQFFFVLIAVSRFFYWFVTPFFADLCQI